MILDQFDHILLLGRTNGNINKLFYHAGYLIHETLKAINNGVELENVIYDQIKRFSFYKKADISDSGDDYVKLWHVYNNYFKSEKRIEISTDLKLLRDCDIIIIATSDPTPFLNKNYFKKGALICDTSVPLNCDDELLRDPDFQVIKGGIVKLINEESLYPPGLYLNKGQAFACMAETMLMGFEHALGHYSFGEIMKPQVDDLGRRVLYQGFIVDEYVEEIIY